MAFNDIPIDTLKRKIDEAKRFLSISLSISNAHTVDFYTRDVWSMFMCVSPEEVLCAISSTQDRMGAIEGEIELKNGEGLGCVHSKLSMINERWQTVCVDFTKLPFFPLPLFSLAGAQDAVLVGLHTCGDLAPSTLRMFRAKQELRAVCSVGCCYHLLSEEFDQDRQGCVDGVCGFPMSQYLKAQACFCGRNARMSACLALERVSAGGGLPMESLFYRAVLHVILRNHYDSFKSEKRVGNVFSKASSFVDYVRRALRKLDLDDTTLSDGDIQSYHELYSPRMNEMVAFNMLKVTLAPCIEGLILLDRLCYLKEQDNVSHTALVQLFDPLQSPRCYAVVGIKESTV
ncbi:methyltransferase-like protein 25 [Sinocyclocheilus grahami]|uniref:methyltransferase-like protein 25 n=1 Tax=Sinocyclocheilus grahami TaxID=75366 RepID=UPI0007ACF289|nr:PREDICTED: methyltransferase-like protein 25 [Sinocyclocheilus grahami]